MRVVDSHFHTWDLEKQAMSWLDGESEKLRRSFTYDGLATVYEHLGITLAGAVHVEADADDPVLEHSLLQSRLPANVGIVAHAHLSADMAIPAGCSGIRDVLHVSSSPRGRCLDTDFLAGLSKLGEAGLPFDACIRVEELEDLYRACRFVPHATVVLDHLGNGQQLTPDYQKVMEKLGSLPNVYCKLSGLPAPEGQDVLQFIASVFPWSRLLYSSNWPVVLTYSGVRENLALLRETFEDSPLVFTENAVRVYNLERTSSC
ncbi:amidohydrolase family protein [Corynebacterium glucuronolyticum]